MGTALVTGLPSLDELAIKYDTDKSSIYHDYCGTYEELFGPLRHEPVALLELGVYDGASLRAWNDYFTHPETVIAGIDNDLGNGAHTPFRQRYGAPLPGIVTYHADQAEVPWGLRNWHPDIIVDDASHYSSKTIASFRTWFPILQSGGLYVIEDVGTSYDTYYSGEAEASPDPDLPPRLAPEAQTAMQFLRRLADEVQAYAWRRTIEDQYLLGFEIAWLRFYPNLVIMRKSVR